MPEIVWDGKYRDGVRVSPSREVVALHTDEVHEGEGMASPWRNRLVLGDQARVLPTLARELAGQVSLVYVDPPFETGGDFDFLASVHGAPEHAPRVAVPAYRDSRGLDSWLAWFDGASRITSDLLAVGGSLYVHLDAHVAHYAKAVLDEVFGPAAFQREIVWRIGWVSGFKSRARGWIRNHDTLLFYAKGGRPTTFHKEYIPYPPGYVRRDGKPPRGRGYPDRRRLERQRHRSDGQHPDHVLLRREGGVSDAEERVARLAHRAGVLEPGDLVLDFCVGSGTTAVVAEKLGRRWVACDVSPIAVHATRKRLLRLPKLRPLVVQHAGDPSAMSPPDRASAAPLPPRLPSAPRRLGARVAVEGAARR